MQLLVIESGSFCFFEKIGLVVYLLWSIWLEFYRKFLLSIWVFNCCCQVGLSLENSLPMGECPTQSQNVFLRFLDTLCKERFKNEQNMALSLTQYFWRCVVRNKRQGNSSPKTKEFKHVNTRYIRQPEDNEL